MSLDLFRVDGGIQFDNSVQITEGANAPSHDAELGSTYHRTDSVGGVYVKVAAGTGTDKWELQALKSYVDTEISVIQAAVAALGNAFNYISVLAGGDQSTPYDLSSLPAAGKDTGDYYKVTTAGWFVVGAGSPFYANVGDGLVFTTLGDVDKIDNTNSEVSGTTDFVSVTGSTDTGYVVDIASAFKTRVATLETDLAAETLARTNGDSTLTAALIAETSARQAADTTLTSNLAAEVTARTNADTALQAAIAAEETARIAGDDATNASLSAEIIRATAAEGVLTAAIAAEETARIAGDATLTTNLAAEVTRATAAEGVLTAAIAAETTNRTSGDANLQAQIDALEASTQTTTTLASTSASDTVTAVAAKWIVYVKQTDTPANINAYEIFAATNGVDVDFTRFSILRLGVAISGLTTGVVVNSGDLVLTVSAGVNVDVSIKRVSLI